MALQEPSPRVSLHGEESRRTTLPFGIGAEDKLKALGFRGFLGFHDFKVSNCREKLGFKTSGCAWEIASKAVDTPTTVTRHLCWY